ncbi:hypothetical protein I4F81_004465 [Pyropia yezoensis]|uniref:Uncharacterized protein n=1 Tax=Pyropia yezoensis TaxID=2788 RepID=A0ACC3BVF0_PYRYE|nr:hypothetical protein I4F81_004465 [Neopyropia yezoensis]
MGLDAADALSSDGIAALAAAVIRPPRASYTTAELGPPTFVTAGARVDRLDVALVNRRGLRLAASHYVPRGGGRSCRVEARALAPVLLPYGVSLFALDFSGSGRSDGEYISLGVLEQEDVAAAVRMGAATALLYAGRSARSGVAGVVADSAFHSFGALAAHLVAAMPLPAGVPRRLVTSSSSCGG